MTAYDVLLENLYITFSLSCCLKKTKNISVIIALYKKIRKIHTKIQVKEYFPVSSLHLYTCCRKGHNYLIIVTMSKFVFWLTFTFSCPQETEKAIFDMPSVRRVPLSTVSKIAARKINIGTWDMVYGTITYSYRTPS